MHIWLFGDSIFRGAALDRFPDEYTPEQAGDEPLWPLRAPAEVINLALGEQVAVLAGNTGLPTGVDKCERRLAKALRRQVAAHDIVVFLDVGPHAEDPAEHAAQWLRLRRTVVAEHPVRLIMCGGFDDGARGQPALQHPPVFNAAVRAAAEAPIPSAGRTSFLELQAPLSAFDRMLTARFGVSAYRADGVHLNVWGQARLCALLLDACGLGGRLAPAPVRAALAGAWAAAGAPSAAAAREMAALVFASIHAPVD